ncbi:MAG: tyrosine-type recombinase/integrase [bacterium]
MAEVLRLHRDIPETWKEILKLFIFWKQVEGRAPRTLKDYADHVTRFFHRYPDSYPDHLREAVLSYMAQEGIKPTTYNLRREYLRGFFSWCCREGYLQKDPTAGLPKRKDEGRIVNIPPEILTRLLSLPDVSTFAGLRDRALLFLCFDTGIRPGEALALRPSDVNLPALEVYVKAESAKTRTRRTLPISPPTAKALHEVISARHPGWALSVPLFPTFSGRPMSSSGWGHVLEKYVKKLGVKITPYSLRHAFALNFLRNGGNVFSLQRMMGHSDLTMTKKYLALTQEDIRAEHQRASPVLALIPERHRVRKIK